MDKDFTERLRKGANDIRASSAMSYAPAAGAPLALEIAADEIDDLRIERDKAVAELCRWRSAFQECTPGGSEFMSPESVIAYMRNLKRETVEAKLELARLRKTL